MLRGTERRLKGVVKRQVKKAVPTVPRNIEDFWRDRERARDLPRVVFALFPAHRCLCL